MRNVRSTVPLQFSSDPTWAHEATMRNRRSRQIGDLLDECASQRDGNGVARLLRAQRRYWDYCAHGEEA
jgi:hypothetical protein